MEGASNVLLSWYNNIDDDVSSFPEFGKCQKINPSFSRRWTFDRYYKLPSAKKFIIVLQSTLRLQQTLKKCILFGLAAWIGSCICAYLHKQKHGHMWVLVVWYSKKICSTYIPLQPRLGETFKIMFIILSGHCKAKNSTMFDKGKTYRLKG